MKKICVFCGSSMGYDPIYRKKAEELADYLIANDLTLVYGGADVGLMKILADRMLAKNKMVIGIMPTHLIEKEVAHHGLTEMIEVESMATRKEKMLEISDAFIALPGGFGTLDEIAEVLVLDQLKIIEKPMGLLNTKNFFDPLVRYFELGVGEGFIRQEHLNNLMVDTEVDALMNKLDQYQAVEMGKWIEDIKIESK